MADDSPWSPDEYDRLTGFSSDWRDTWWHDDFLELMLRRWRATDVRSVVDVGCGVGHWGQRLAGLMGEGVHLTGVDREPTFVDKARDRAESLGLGGRSTYLPGTAEALPLGDSSVDMATCQTVLIHVADAAVALDEMKRVVRPGGLVVVAESDNLASALSMMNVVPRPPWQEVEALLRFQYICEQGKAARGDGDSSIGGRLPGLMSAAGLVDLRVFSNDCCPWQVAPYDRPAQRAELEVFFDWIESDHWMAAGPRDHAEKLFVAGGGDPVGFETEWQRAMAHQRAFRAAVESGQLNGARGVLHYLISGRVSEQK